MKRLLIFLSLVLSINTLTLWSANDLVNDSKDVVLEKKKKEKPRPRDLIQVPISCFYSDGSLFFTFMEDLGEVEITVTNQNIGAVFFDEIDTFGGSAVLETSTASGIYQIQIETETGDIYEGEYILY